MDERDTKEAILLKKRQRKQRTLKTVAIAVLVVLLLPLLLYVPPIQRAVVSYVSEKVSAASGYDVRMDRFLLKFPFRLAVDNLSVLDQQKDTLLASDQVIAGIRLIPLIEGDLSVQNVELSNTICHYADSDSVMQMTAKLQKFTLQRSIIDLFAKRLDMSEAELSKGDVEITIDNRKSQPSPEDKQKGAPWLLNLGKLTISDVRYRMRMMPAIDSLDTHLTKAVLQNVSVNMACNMVRTGYLGIDGISANYFTPTPEAVKKFGKVPDDTTKKSSDEPWAILADSIRIRNVSATYATRNAKPGNGFDPDYVQVSNVDIAVDSLLSRGSRLRIPLRKLSADERCGLGIRQLSGVFEINDTIMSAKGFRLNTLMSEISLDATINSRIFSLQETATADIDLRTDISLEEVGKAMPSFRAMLRSVSRTKNAVADFKLHGTGREVEVEKLSLNIERILRLSAKGNVNYPLDSLRANGSLKLDGRITGGELVRRMAGLPPSMRIPSLYLHGNASYRRNLLAGNLTANTAKGSVHASGDWRISRNAYGGNVTFRSFDMRSIMPGGTIGKINGKISAHGQGFNLFRMTAAADATISNIEYDGMTYSDINLAAKLRRGQYAIDLSSGSEFADLALNASGKFDRNGFSADLNGIIGRLDFEALKLTTNRLAGQADIQMKIGADNRHNRYFGFARLSNMIVELPKTEFYTDSIDVGLWTDSTHTGGRIRNMDLSLGFIAKAGIRQLTDSLQKITTAADSMIRRQRVDIALLKRTIPDFRLTLKSGNNNIVHRYMADTGVSFRNMSMNMEHTDSTELTLTSLVNGLKTGGVVIDTLRLDANTAADSLLYKFHVSNRLPNADLFKTADFKGYATANRLVTEFFQTDKADETGFNIGAALEIADSTIRFNLYPENPTVAFRKWTLNADNFATLNLRDTTLLANIQLGSSDASHIRIYTDEKTQKHTGVNIDLAGIELQDWLTLSPFSPPIEGTLSSKVKLFHHNQYTWGNGDVHIADLCYGKSRVGDVDLSSKMAYVGDSRKIYAMAGMNIDGKQVVDIKGFRNDSLPESPYDLKMQLINLPMRSIGAFIPTEVGNLSGALNGELSLKGPIAKPDINGYVRFDTTQIVSPSFGASFAFDTTRIPIEKGIAHFRNYGLIGTNGNPISINGHVGLSPSGKMPTDLELTGRNVQIVSGKKTGRSELYGRGFANIKASVNGNLTEELDVDAAIAILSGTNLTYIMQTDATTAVAETGNKDAVKFVQLNDTASVTPSDTVKRRTFGMRLNTLLTIQPNAIFTVNLSPDGKNKAQIDGDGTLNFTQSPFGDMSLSGRYVIREGFVRYSPPMLSEKMFTFDEGSSIVWSGDMLNPTLSIKAVDRVKANVTSDSQNSRLVPFDIALNISNTLQELNVNFDLSTDGDVTIANELSSMTAEQRSTQAMNLLLYNTYTGTSTKATSNLSGNMAYSFLASSLNKWAASAITGVDVSFNINQYDKTVDGATSTTTNYSYQVSKSVLNDRFKISVGGSYSSDATAQDNLAQNLLNDISFEYKLNRTGSMYVRLFRHTEYESILEGEITETGGGFVWRRKISSWRDFFRVFRIMRRAKKRSSSQHRPPVRRTPTQPATQRIDSLPSVPQNK